IHRRMTSPLQLWRSELEREVSPLHLFDMPTFNLANFENLMIHPSVDIIDDQEHFKVEAELPGMGEKDVLVNISKGLLTIKGEKSVSTKNKGKNYVMREIGYGSYARSIALPDTVDIDKASASFKKGMLWVTIPKKQEISQKSRNITIEAAK